jgi:hypothetical protein
MRITKRHLRRIIKETCGLDTSPVEELPAMLPTEAEAPATDPDVPSPEDYEMTRQMLDQNQDIVDLGLSMVMDMAGTTCERSTAQAIIDHLQDMLDAGPSAAAAPPVDMDLASLEDVLTIGL